MILGCRLDHLRNADVTVNGNTYRVGDNGICTDVADADAACLLTSAQWYKVGASQGAPIDFVHSEMATAKGAAKTASDQLDAIGLPPDWRAKAASAAAQEADIAHKAHHQSPMHPVTPAEATAVAPAVAAGAAYSPGIPPVEAPTLKDVTASKPKRRGRPKKA